jgi:hypothetical protein
MRKIASGKQVIPDCLKVRDRLNCTLSMYKMLIFLQLHAEELITAGDLDEYNFGANSNNLVPDQPPNAHSDEEVWKLTCEVLFGARQCEESLASEPTWNTKVHTRILNLVLFGWREDRHLFYNDV